MKKLLILLVCVAIFGTGCGKPLSGSQQGNQAKTQVSRETTVSRSVYVIDDKAVYCKGFIINKKTKIRKMIHALGKWTSEQPQAALLCFSYPGESPVIYLNSEGFKKVTEIDITKVGTSKGLKEGDQYEKMIKLYGKPSRQGQNKTGDMYYFYDGKDSTLFVSIYDRVNRIEIQYEKFEGIYD